MLAQGVDGSPQQLLTRFQRSPEAALLGTASFWEGVDVGNEALKVLVVARLPFNVPTEPIFAARSEEYENSFMEYAVPQAVLRFRQGFGRLIRSKGDRGVVVVLDSRIVTKQYGRMFLQLDTAGDGPAGAVPSTRAGSGGMAGGAVRGRPSGGRRRMRAIARDFPTPVGRGKAARFLPSQERRSTRFARKPSPQPSPVFGGGGAPFGCVPSLPFGHLPQRGR